MIKYHNNKLRNLIIVATTLCLCSLQTIATDNDNVWFDYGINGKITDKVSITLAEELRYTEKDFDFVYRHTDLRFTIKIYPGWDLEPTFRYTEKYKNGETISIPGGYLNINNSNNYKEANIKTRIRFFYGDTGTQNNIIDLRPKILLTPKKGWTDIKLKPYIADEIMIDLNDFRLYKNRFSLGIQSTPYKIAKVGAFIMQEQTETVKDLGWQKAYNIGLSLFFNF